MSRVLRSTLVAVIHVALLTAVGAVLLSERRSLPAVWAATTGVDPVLPIRGRYVALNLIVEPRGAMPPLDEAASGPPVEATLSVEGGRLVATILPPPDIEAAVAARGPVIRRWQAAPDAVWVLDEPIAFFLPENAPDPSRLEPGQVLWAEVTVPRRGAPRPIRLEARPAGAARPESAPR